MNTTVHEELAYKPISGLQATIDPSQLKISMADLTSTFGSFEAELAASKLLKPSKERNQWTAVSMIAVTAPYSWPLDLGEYAGCLPGFMTYSIMGSGLIVPDAWKFKGLDDQLFQTLHGLHQLIAAGIVEWHRTYAYVDSTTQSFLLDFFTPTTDMITRLLERQASYAAKRAANPPGIIQPELF